MKFYNTNMNRERIYPKLTLKEFKLCVSSCVLAEGIRTLDLDDGEGERTYNFVAVKGKVNDWAVYYSYDIHKHLEHVRRLGTKAYDMKLVRALIDCSEDVYKLYRS